MINARLFSNEGLKDGHEINLDLQTSINDLDHALRISARIVVLYGDNYLPIFERLHAEVSRAKEKKETKNLAIELAKKYAVLE